VLKVNIHEKMSKIEDMYVRDDVSGYYVYDGKVLENIKDTTFAKNFILHNSNFAQISSAEGGGTPVKWVRFP